MRRRTLLLCIFAALVCSAAVFAVGKYVLHWTIEDLPAAASMPAAPAHLVAQCNSEDPVAKMQGCTALIKQPIMLARDRALAFSRRSDVFAAASRLDDAIADRLSAARMVPHDPAYRTRVAATYFLRGTSREAAADSAGALEDYLEALRIEPRHEASRVAAASLQYRASRMEAAIGLLQDGLGIEPNAVCKALLAKLHEQRAIALTLQGDLAAAVTAYTAALAIDPVNASLLVQRGSAFALQGDHSSATADFSAAIREAPQLAEAYLRRAEVHYRANGLLLSLADLNHILTLNPRDIDALMLRAIVREANEQPAYALEDYRRMLAIQPGSQPARSAIGRLTHQVEQENPDPPPSREFQPPSDKFCIGCTEQEEPGLRPPVLR